jgi:hypothetical protein
MRRRRIFISFCYSDQMQAKGFHLLRWNRNVDLDFVGRHLLDPVDSTDNEYIARRVREQIANTSVTVVLLGKDTCDSEWVENEITWSLRKETPNGILGIKLRADAVVPKVLHECGAEILNWRPHEFAEAIERAARVAGRPVGPIAKGGQTACGR